MRWRSERRIREWIWITKEVEDKGGRVGSEMGTETRGKGERRETDGWKERNIHRKRKLLHRRKMLNSRMRKCMKTVYC